MSRPQKNNKRLTQALFLVPQKWQLKNTSEFNAELEYFNRKAAAQRAGEYSLVKRGESPTEKFRRAFELNKHKSSKSYQDSKQRARFNKTHGEEFREHQESVFSCPEPVSLPERKKTPLSAYLSAANKFETISNETRTCVRMFSQGWSGKFKFNLVTGALGSKTAPPATSGDRITSELTKNATKKILESGAYLSAARNGYTTFLTLTFSPESRQALTELVAKNRNKAKEYQNKLGQKFAIECIHGVPNELVNIDDETVKAYSSTIPASGAFSLVEFVPKTTIGKEVSRFFDGVQKIYQRGFKPEFELSELDKNIHGQQFKPSLATIEPALKMFCPELVTKKSNSGEILSFEECSDFERYNPRKHTDIKYMEKNAAFGMQKKAPPLDYMWVAEQPENENGEKNPHVHVLMRWQVEHKYFLAWAKRLEKLWGHGFAKLERIHTPAAASNYLLKAVGYLSKGASNDQGEILGNRYGISASARAPKWECIGEFYADNFIGILGELREKLERKKARLNAKINAEINVKPPKGKEFSASKKELIAGVAKLNAINKKTPTEARQKYIEAIKAELLNNDKMVKSCNDYKNQLPYMNEFCIGGLDEEQATNFLHWAMSERFWNAEVKENRYSKWSELKQNTIEAVKHARRFYRHSQWINETAELTWRWAENDSQFDVLSTRQNVILDDDGNLINLAA